jgi:hypothetical protein
MVVSMAEDVDLEVSVAHRHLERLTGLEVELVAELLGHHDAPRAVDGGFHGRTLPFSDPLGAGSRPDAVTRLLSVL